MESTSIDHLESFDGVLKGRLHVAGTEHVKVALVGVKNGEF